MRNLLKETTEAIADEGHTVEDVQWVGAVIDSEEEGWSCSWQEFEKEADLTYHAGYGGQEINEYLLVVGSNWWLERHEYDGRERWEHKTLPMRPARHRKASLLSREYMR